MFEAVGNNGERFFEPGGIRQYEIVKKYSYELDSIPKKQFFEKF